MAMTCPTCLAWCLPESFGLEWFEGPDLYFWFLELLRQWKYSNSSLRLVTLSANDFSGILYCWLLQLIRQIGRGSEAKYPLAVLDAVY